MADRFIPLSSLQPQTQTQTMSTTGSRFVPLGGGSGPPTGSSTNLSGNVMEPTPQYAGTASSLLRPIGSLANTAGYGSLGSGIGTAAGALALYQAIQNQSPTGIAGGTLGTASNLANLAGYSNVGGAIGALGGPLSLYSGITNEDPFGILSGVYGTLSGASTVSGMLGGPTASSILASLGGGAGAVGGGAGALGGAGVGAGAGGVGGAVTGGELALGAGAGVGAGAGGAGGAGTGAALGGSLAGMAAGAPVAVAALAPIFDMLIEKYGIGINQPTSAELSQRAADTGVNYLQAQIGQNRDLSGLTNILNTSFAPHGELQMGSSPQFGWAGDYNDPASQNWMTALGLLRNPDMVNSGMAWVDPFVRNLWIKSGQTGAADQFQTNDMYSLQQQLANALPNLPAYQALKASYAPGGDVYSRMQPIVDAYNTANTNRLLQDQQARTLNAPQIQDQWNYQYGSNYGG